MDINEIVMEAMQPLRQAGSTYETFFHNKLKEVNPAAATVDDLTLAQKKKFFALVDKEWKGVKK